MKELTGLSLTDLWKDFWTHSNKAIKVMRKTLIEEALKAKRWQYIVCSEYERNVSRTDYRNDTGGGGLNCLYKGTVVQGVENK